MPRALFFRSELLPLSETFIVGQATALYRYDPWFAGLKCVPGGLPLDKARVIAATGKNSLREKVTRRIYLESGIAPRFLRRIEAAKPDLIHAHFATDACAALPIQNRLRVPLIVTLYGYDVTSDDAALRALDVGRAYLRRRQELWARTSVFVCISEFIRQKALARGFPPEKLWVHPIGVDVDYFQPGRQERKEPLILFVGRLVEKKGVVHLLRAMRTVQTQMPEARLVIMGDGPQRDILESEAQEKLQRCEFIGSASSSAVQTWMQKAAVVAAPSVIAANGDAEGLCMVACEAQAMGVPVVSFAGPGISESVAHGETGLLVPQRDESALAEAMLTLLRDEALALAMGIAGRRRVEQLFNVKRQAGVIEQKYDEVLEAFAAVQKAARA